MPFGAEDVAYTLNTLARPRPQGALGRGCAAGRGERDGDRRQYRGDRFQDPGAAVLLLHDLQIRHRRLHRAEAHLRGTGLDDLQAFRPGQEVAGHHRPLAGRRRLAAAEGLRPPSDLVGGRAQPGAAAGGRAQHLSALRRRAAGGAGADHEPARCRHRHAARHLPDRVPPEPEDHHPYRPEIALRLHGLVADLALRQQRASALRRQGCALGVELLHRPPATDRGRLSRRQQPLEIADAALPAVAALFRRGQGPAGQVRHQRIRAQEGRRLLAAKGFKKDGDGFWTDAEGKRLGRQHHRLRRVGAGDRPGAGRDAQAPRRSMPAWRCRPTSTTGSRRASSTARSTAMAARSTSPMRHCGSTRAPRSPFRARTRRTSRAGRTPNTTSWWTKPTASRPTTRRS